MEIIDDLKFKKFNAKNNLNEILKNKKEKNLIYAVYSSPNADEYNHAIARA
jgi:hypothetical protein